MCLGIPGQLVEMLEAHEHLARVDVAGVGRIINIGLLEDEPLEPGDWVLIHVGFAMSKIDEEEAAMAMASLRMMGAEFTDEVEALMTSRITTDTDGRRAVGARNEEVDHGCNVGIVIGYVLGTRAGDKGYEELRDAWKTITSVRRGPDMVIGGIALAGDMAPARAAGCSPSGCSSRRSAASLTRIA